MRKFSELLDEGLQEIQRSNRWLAGIVGMHPGTIGNYRRGTSEPSLTDAARIAEVVGFDLKECYGEEGVKNLKVNEGQAEYITQKLKGGAIEVAFFTSGVDLLAALNENALGSIDLAMAKEKFLVLESLSHDVAFAVKVDHLFDCDEDQEIITVRPWEGGIEENKTLLFTTDPPKEFYLRRVILQEDDKFILRAPYKKSNVVYSDDIVILGIVKYRCSID